MGKQSTKLIGIIERIVFRSIINTSSIFVGSIIHRCIFYCSIFYNSIFINSIIHNCFVYSSVIHSSIVHSSIVYSSVVHSGVIHGSIVHSSIVYSSVVHSGVIHGSIVHSNLVFHKDRINSSVIDVFNSETIYDNFLYGLFLDSLVFDDNIAIIQNNLKLNCIIQNILKNIRILGLLHLRSRPLLPHLHI
ncbi:hypothetical protein IMSHALPRED_001764 [Imshaugia aleurites]|uniref:Uncharacterized protein n=1 Tax=Imshaugia aleurites TaxID=172621 RepID=A0A8H3J3N1_9LECA|nr:hypothetical protein IMSHALPRED_001764 [Imshaugia aleurites]